MDLNEIPIDIEPEYKGDIESDDESDFIEKQEDKQPHLVEDSSEVESRITPKKGMIFETLEESKVFYENYARYNGFGTKIRTTTKNEETVRYIAYACSREGERKKNEQPYRTKHRAETRCHCPARMGVSVMKDTGKYQVSVFTSLHNHDLENKRTTHFFRAHRSIDKIQGYAIDMAESAGLGPTKIHRLMSLEAAGSENLGFTKPDIRSYLRTKRIQDVSLRELNAIQSYISDQSKKNQSFFHDHQVDRLGKLTNFFWADAKMIVDYEAFGDVLSFDTTFGTNKETRPLAIFSGFNNHRQIVIFGIALLYDETGLSFGWVFQTFLRCHKEKLPCVIYTDQEKAMENAIGVVMPEVRHALCTWHLFKNANENMKGALGEKITPFIDDFRSCVHDYISVDEFEQKWQLLVDTYGIVKKDWFKELYKKKEKWSFAYLKDVFLAGARTTQVSESVNSMLKRDLGSCLTMRKFFRGFDIFLKNVRDNELESDFKARQTSPYLAITYSPILRHAAKTYTPKLFLRFQKQFDAEHSVRLNTNSLISEPHERIAYQNGLAYNIRYDPSSATISCSCYMYETHGYLCAHILRVFNISDVNQIPEKYIMKRWTKEAKSGLDVVAFTAPDLDAQMIRTALCSEFNRLVYRVGSSKSFANELRRLINEGNKFIDAGEVIEGNNVNGVANTQCVSASEHIFLGVTGLKKKERKKPGRKRRIRSGLEISNGFRKNKNGTRVEENSLTNEDICLTL